MTTKKTFKNIILARCYRGEVMLVTGPKGEIEELGEMLDGGSHLEDYGLGELVEVPKEPGLYVCEVDFEFQQGYFEGYPANGESSWYLIPKNVTRIA